MIINTFDGKTIDTEADLTAEERHVLQKIFLWVSLAKNIEQFREEKKKALLKGWNCSGSISESPALKSIINHLEKNLISRLATDRGGNEEQSH
ncbi:MAG: hypothetical protein JXL81_11165 [Deltaproteobacteria bacterium]|nr:hypothetical protein [Deltaproteobacteria bacterium]